MTRAFMCVLIFILLSIIRGGFFLCLFLREYYDLMNGLLVLQYLMERRRIPIFESVSVALHCTSKVMNLI